jgi:hypothetical protein
MVRRARPLQTNISVIMIIIAVAAVASSAAVRARGLGDAIESVIRIVFTFSAVVGCQLYFRRLSRTGLNDETEQPNTLNGNRPDYGKMGSVDESK